MAELNTEERNKNRQNGSNAHRLGGAQLLLKKMVAMPVIPMLFVIWIVFIVLSNKFLTVNNITTLFVANSFFAVAAIGEAFVLMTGGIDLSIAHTMTCSSIVSAVAMVSYQKEAVNRIVNAGAEVIPIRELLAMPGIDRNAVYDAMAATQGTAIFIGLIVALAVGLAFGLVNGISIGFFKMTPFVITLATQLIARGISFVLSNGISIPGTPTALTEMSYKTGIHIGPNYVLPWVVVISLSFIVVFGVILGKTTWGRHITLTGSNPEAARYVGIKTKLIFSSVYIVAGFLAGVAGFMTIMSLGTADPKVGDPLLLTIIGSVILGGVSMTGGEGSMTKAALGMLLFATLINGMTFLNLSLALQQIIQGVILIIGMALGVRLVFKRT